MRGRSIAQRRLAAQFLAEPTNLSPRDVVATLGAVQAQDYPAAKWALGLRCAGATDASVEAALNEGSILRTHVLRPTWHFVAAADLRWMLALTAPRIKAAMASVYRRMGLDEPTQKRVNATITKALDGGQHLTRPALAKIFERAKMRNIDSHRVGHVMMRAELDGLVCSGARTGKSATYALLEERVPAAKAFSREEALRELAMRYFTTRGPATLQDFAWWSGLTVADGRNGVEMATPALDREVIEGKTYWFRDTPLARPGSGVPRAHLLPNYDEYIVAYKDRRAIMELAKKANASLGERTPFQHAMIMDGQLMGDWKRLAQGERVVIALDPFVELTPVRRRAIRAAALRYAAFLGRPVEVQGKDPMSS